MITVDTSTMVLKCDCHHTQTMAKVENGVLYIMSKHHGETHVAHETLDTLLKLCNDSQVKQLM